MNRDLERTQAVGRAWRPDAPKEARWADAVVWTVVLTVLVVDALLGWNLF